MPDPLRGRIRSDGTKIYEDDGVRISITPRGGMSISSRSSKRTSCSVTMRNKDVYINGVRVEWGGDSSNKETKAEEKEEYRGIWKAVALYAVMLLFAFGLIVGTLFYIKTLPSTLPPAEAPLK